MTSSRILVITTLVLLSGSATPAAPARAAAAETTCVYEHDVVASPGLSTSASSGSVASGGETGTVTCDGPVNGKRPTGPGTSGADGRYGTKDGDTCQAGGEGDAVYSFTIPTSGGAENIDDPMAYTYGAFKAGAPFSGKFQGERTSGTFDVQPIDGDCASNPVTKFHVKGKFTLKN